jgi:predicted Fe-S protein YdhL (DUF1289 family)
MDTARMETPCINVCVIEHATGLCVGCRRTRDEISRWIELGARARRRIMAELPLRTPAESTGSGK